MTNPPSRPAPPRPPASASPPPVAPAAPSGICKELDVLIRARYPIIYVVSWEEERVEQQLAEIARQRNKKFFIWTLTQGLVRHGTAPGPGKGNSTTDPVQALNQVIDQVDPTIFLFKDFHPFTADNRVNLSVIRRLRDVAHNLRDSYKTVVIVSPVLEIAPELTKDVTVLEFGLRPPLN